LKGEVWLFNDSLSVTQIEFKILQHMMENPNLIITREDLINHIYPNTDQTILDRTIDAHIKKLRKKIEKDPANPDRILTVRGWGYNSHMFKRKKTWFPKKILWRLTIPNMVVISIF